MSTSTPARILNHPIHPMLIVFPIGLWVFSFIADIIYLLGGPAGWLTASFYAMGVGIVGAALAAIPGFADLLSLAPSRARTVGIWHMVINVLALVLYAINFGVRWDAGSIEIPFVLSSIGVASLLVSGWLGGELVYVLGVAVNPEANIDLTPPQNQRPDDNTSYDRKAA